MTQKLQTQYSREGSDYFIFLIASLLRTDPRVRKRHKYSRAGFGWQGEEESPTGQEIGSYIFLLHEDTG